MPRQLSAVCLIAFSASTIVLAGCSASANTDFDLNGGSKSLGDRAFSKLNISRGISVEVVEGPHAVSAEGSNQALERLVVDHQGDTLNIYLDRLETGSWLRGLKTNDIVVHVSAPTLDAVATSSGSSVEITDMDLRSINVSVSSGAKIAASGKCDDIKVSASSGARMSASNLRCAHATIQATSGSRVKVFADSAVTAHVSSGGNVDVNGSPGSVTKHVSSGGRVKIH